MQDQAARKEEIHLQEAYPDEAPASRGSNLLFQPMQATIGVWCEKGLGIREIVWNKKGAQNGMSSLQLTCPSDPVVF